MKVKAIAGAALLCVAAGGARAAAVEFRGAMCVTAVTTACAADGWSVGDCLLLRYSPPNLGSNGAATEFSVLGQSFGDNYSLAAGSLVGTTLQPVVGLHIGRTGYSFSATMRLTSQSPVPAATTRSLSLAGNIGNFGGTTGCTIGFRASATNRP